MTKPRRKRAKPHHADFIGWVGYSDNQPCFDRMTDEYSRAGETVLAAEIFRRKKDARKRFEDVREVYVGERGDSRR